jgi:hypothetical protein
MQQQVVILFDRIDVFGCDLGQAILSGLQGFEYLRWISREVNGDIFQLTRVLMVLLKWLVNDIIISNEVRNFKGTQTNIVRLRPVAATNFRRRSTFQYMLWNRDPAPSKVPEITFDPELLGRWAASVGIPRCNHPPLRHFPRCPWHNSASNVRLAGQIKQDILRRKGLTVVPFDIWIQLEGKCCPILAGFLAFSQIRRPLVVFIECQ